VSKVDNHSEKKRGPGGVSGMPRRGIDRLPTLMYRSYSPLTVGETTRPGIMQPMSRRTLLPVLAATGALLVAAWFYLGTRQASDLATTNAILNAGDHLSAADARHALSLLRSAAFLNPDRMVELDRSRIAVETGHKRRAYRLATSVTDAEPMNAVAWQYVARAASNSGVVDAAFAHFAKLVAPAAR
jgi:hypothetical protein